MVNYVSSDFAHYLLYNYTMEIQDVIQYVTDGESQPITHVQAKIADLAEVSPKTVAAWMSADRIPIRAQALMHWKTNYRLKMPEYD